MRKRKAPASTQITSGFSSTRPKRGQGIPVAVHPPIPPFPGLQALPPLTAYDDVLNSLVGLGKANLTQAEVNNWPRPQATDEGRIEQEQAQKFLERSRLPIQEVEESNNPASAASYNGRDLSLFIPKAPKRNKNPVAPGVLGHELVHANDHQHDNLNAKGWRHFHQLYDDSGRNEDAFKTSIARMGYKVDPTGVLSRQYPDDFNWNKIRTDIINWYANQAQQHIAQGFVPPAPPILQYSTAVGADNWTQLFPEIQKVVKHVDPVSLWENRPFFLGGPSEFFGFMHQNLTNPWDTKSQFQKPLPPGLKSLHPDAIPPLEPHEAQTLSRMTGDFAAAHPPAPTQGSGLSAGQSGSDSYPVTNYYANQRRNSIIDAYLGPGASGAPLPPGWSRGGRVTGKNLLARFIKPKRKAS